MFPTLMRRLAQTARPQFNATTNPVYKLKKVWPPDIKNMTSQQQLRFEKKYKRRLKLATARPRFDKFIRLAQLFTMTCTVAATRGFFRVRTDSVLVVLTYVVLFMDWKDVPTPFDPVRPLPGCPPCLSVQL
jgi:hypothetical protein